MKTNDGGPAFPRPGFTASETESQEGMTLRDYFAAKAPKEVPDWFRPILSPAPKRPANADWCEGCKADSDCDKTLQCIAMHEWSEAKEACKDFNYQETYFQWRWYYADAMLKEREK